MDKSDWKQREWRKERGGDKQTMENAVIKKREKKPQRKKRRKKKLVGEILLNFS